MGVRRGGGRGGGEIKAVRWKLLFFLENHVPQPAARTPIAMSYRLNTVSRSRTDDDGA